VRALPLLLFHHVTIALTRIERYFSVAVHGHYVATALHATIMIILRVFSCAWSLSATFNKTDGSEEKTVGFPCPFMLL
jgi:hypothetical protein